MEPGQTPVLAAKGGGGDLFSAACAKLLRRVGFEPDDFGTHSYQAKRLAAIRKDHGLGQDGEPIPGKAQPKGPPTPRDKMLAACQAGHMVQNAVFAEGGERAANDPCGVPPPPPEGPGLCDGELLPCIPLSGNAVGNPGIMHRVGTSVEITCSNREKVDQTAAALEEGSDARYTDPPHAGKLRYRGEQVEMDYQANNFAIASCLASQQKTKQTLEEIDASRIYKRDKKADAASKRADQAEAADARQRAAAEQLQTGAVGKPASPTAPNDPPLLNAAEVKELADCLDNFVKDMIARMQNQLIKAEEDAQKAQQDAQKKIAEHEAKKQDLEKQKQALPPPPAAKKERAKLDKAIAAEEKGIAKAQKEKDDATDNSPQGRCRSAAVAKFKQAEAEGRIQRGQLQDGVVPNPSITQTDVTGPTTPAQSK